MKLKELNKTFMMILNWKKNTFGRHGLNKSNSALNIAPISGKVIE